MATFNLASGGTTYWHDTAYTTRAGGDTYNLSLGSILIVDGDCRFGPNTTTATGPPGVIDIAANTGGEFRIDGSGVRLIPYKTGSGNVPALDTAITIGGVSGKLLGVWATIDVAPTAVGAGMPPTGFIKVRQVTGGTYKGGTLGGIGAVALGDTGAALTITVAAGAKTFTRGAGDFIADGIKLGDTVVTSGFTNGGNNGTFVVTTITTTVLTFSAATGLVDETGNGNEQVISQTVDIVGWIDFSADDNGTITVRRLGTFKTRGAWFELGKTSGNRNQTMALPCSGQTAFWISGVWIETAVASGLFEYWPCLTTNANGGWTTANQGTDGRSRAVMCDAANKVIRIGADAAATSIGELPGAGRRVVVPNVFLMTNTTAARTVAVIPNATPATRFEFFTSGGAVIDMEYTECNWCANTAATSLNQCYSITMTNVTWGDVLFLGECATPIIWNSGGVSPINPQETAALIVSSQFNGGTFTDCKFWRGGAIGAGEYSVSLVTCTDLNFVRCRFGQATLNTNATGYSLNVNSCVRTTFTTCWITGGALITTCSFTTFTTTTYIQRHSGTSGATPTMHVWTVAGRSSDTFLDGLDWGGFTNVHAYGGLLSVAASDRTELRNVGTAAAPLTLGSANQTRFLLTTGSGCDGVTLKRVYTDNANGLYSTTNGDKNILLQNVWADAADNFGAQWLSCIQKGCRGFGTVVTSFTASYDNIFWDTFNATTTGKIGIHFNEAVGPDAPYVALTGTAKFTASGLIYMPNSGDTATFTFPYYVIGYNGFTILEETLASASGTIKDRMRVQYQIDKNDGAGFGSYHNLHYNRTGGGGTVGQFTITMTNTVGVEVGDYVFGTNVGASARVTSVDNGTTVTVNVANGGAVSGTLRFNQLPFEASVSQANGFKLNLKITCETTDTTNNTIHTLHVQGITTNDANGIQRQYPLDVVTVTLSNLVVGSRYSILRADGVTLLATGTAASSTEKPTVTYPGAPENIIIRVRKGSAATKYFPFETQAPITRSGASAFISQTPDTLAA